MNINHLYWAIKYYKVHQMADGINFMDFQTSVKTIQKQTSYDLKELSNQLNAYKISLNVSKIKK